MIAIIVGPTWALLYTLAEGMKWVPEIPFLIRAMLDFVVVLFIIWLCRNRGDIPASARIDRTFAPEVAARMAAVPWYISFKFWATILVLSVIALYIRFF
jgi:hypothetical protein